MDQIRKIMRQSIDVLKKHTRHELSQYMKKHDIAHKANDSKEELIEKILSYTKIKRDVGDMSIEDIIKLYEGDSVSSENTEDLLSLYGQPKKYEVQPAKKQKRKKAGTKTSPMLAEVQKIRAQEGLSLKEAWAKYKAKA